MQIVIVIDPMFIIECIVFLGSDSDSSNDIVEMVMNDNEQEVEETDKRNDAVMTMPMEIDEEQVCASQGLVYHCY